MIIGTIIANNASLPLDYVRSILSVHDYQVIFQEGAVIAENRNEIFSHCRLLNDSLLFIDSDIVFTSTQIKQMEKHLKNYDVITGVYVANFPGFPVGVFDLDLHLTELKNKIFEIGGCGGGFLAISSKVIQDLINPFTLIEEKMGRYYGEDISFCLNARKAGYKLYCDPDIKVGHIKNKTLYHGKT